MMPVTLRAEASCNSFRVITPTDIEMMAQLLQAPVCKHCGQPKEWQAHYKEPLWRCIPCSNAQGLQWHRANRAKDREVSRRYYRAHRERKIESTRRWQKANPERKAENYRRWRQANPERIAEFNRRYREANPERVAENNRRYREANSELAIERARRWYQENPEQSAESCRRWREANPEGLMAIRHNRRARKKAAISPLHKVTVAVIKQRFSLTDDCCAYCGADCKLEVEHVVPLSGGGLHVPSNLVGACKSCNCSKRDKPVADWYLKQPFFTQERWDYIQLITKEEES